jgi:predicted phosphoribosyltransferase
VDGAALGPDRRNLIALALPRGGVPVGAQIARRLGVPLGVILVRKLGVPGHEELAMGAVARIGDETAMITNVDVVEQLGIREADFEAVRERELAELDRRSAMFATSTPPVAGAGVIVVDDGLATGATMLAAVAAVRSLQPVAITVAIPVGARQAVRAVAARADRVVCLSTPEPFLAVGAAYRDFRQVTDAQVAALL